MPSTTQSSALAAQACRNCEAQLDQENAYCARCGQAVAARITMHEIGRDMWQAIVSVDRSAVSLIAALLVRPGVVARDYVAGRRKRYFGPFAFLLITVGLASAIIALSGFKAFMSNNPNDIVDFLQQHVNWVILMQVPLLALCTRMLFYEQGLNYAEHLVLASFASSLRALFLGFVVIPYWYVLRPPTTDPNGIYIYFALWLGYFGMAGAQFYNGRRVWSWVRAALAALLAQLATIGLVALATFLYSRYAAQSTGG